MVEETFDQPKGIAGIVTIGIGDKITHNQAPITKFQWSEMVGFLECR
jgi:hypothetical protein